MYYEPFLRQYHFLRLAKSFFIGLLCVPQRLQVFLLALMNYYEHVAGNVTTAVVVDATLVASTTYDLLEVLVNVGQRRSVRH
jgi:hypothetical protein